MPSQRLTVSFCFDLTKPDSPRIEVGTFRVCGDKYLGFEWSLDWESPALNLNPLSLPMFRSLPDTLRMTAEQWPAYRDRSVPAHRKELDPDTLAHYYCFVFGRSSFYISKIEDDVPQRRGTNRAAIA